jgi:hypothetical protein
VSATLRIEIFPTDLNVSADVDTNVHRFTVVRDQRGVAPGYIAQQRGHVNIGAAHREDPENEAGRWPPPSEVVLELDDVEAADYARVAAHGWPVEDGLVDRPSGLCDLRVQDSAGSSLRVITKEWS